MNPIPRSAYVHVPFCLHHCGYCDFTLVANRDQLIPEWLKCLKRELEHELAKLPRPVELDTLFLGGGTPTHLSIQHLQELFELLADYFRFSPDSEISIEANPDGLHSDKLLLLQQCGVNRISLGVQSFQDPELKLLERTHHAADAVAAVELAARYISHVNIDLIFAVPGQSAQSWENSLLTATALPLKHISTYGLTWEQGTPFFRREQRGQLKKTPEDLECRMYLDAIQILQNHGFEHYEVSNFSKPGARCRHNLVYWHANEYFAFGPGAARFVNGQRSTNCRSVPRWLKSWSKATPCLEPDEPAEAYDRAREAIMLGLRLREGFNLQNFRNRYGISIESLAGQALQRSLQHGLAELHSGSLRLTQQGLLIADSVIADFLADD
ncbi:MAG: Oxygen-independent coproporphyrinogen-III oxidase 1 [Planctomycetota bacterium]|jgi:oxygen-independent coproporphyrinogen-3 oxidase